MEARTKRDTEKRDVRDQPAYGLAEAARYVKVPVATLRSWVAGRIDANERAADVAADYDLTVEEVEQALLYERAA